LNQKKKGEKNFYTTEQKKVKEDEEFIMRFKEQVFAN